MSIPIPKALVATMTGVRPGNPGFLPHRALGVSQPAVIIFCGDTFVAQESRDLFGSFAGADIDDAGTADVADDPQELFVFVVGMAHGIREVGTRKIAAQQMGFREAQLSMMSSATRGVAEAVRASTGTPGIRSRSSAIRR